MTLPLVVALSFWGTLLANVVAWALIHAGSGYLVHRLPLRRFERDGWLLRPRALEGEGRAYERILRVQRWKDHLPEAGALFSGGVSKRTLTGTVGRAGLDRFVAETRRAERGHWLALAGAPIFALWNPPSGLALMVAYGVVVNAPFIAVQRYNRQRAQRVLRRRNDGPPPATCGESEPFPYGFTTG
jgi:glycosyl-4,4'-diaponeurosporenoate acyltransferase